MATAEIEAYSSARLLNQLVILYTVALLMDMSVASVMFAISRRAAELGASAGALGLLGAAWLAPYLAVSLVSGRLSDRFGRRNIALLGPLITATVTLVCARTTNVPVLLGLTTVFGLGLGCFWPPIMGWLSDGVRGPQLHARLTCFGIAWNIGLFLGFALTGWVFRHWPPLAFGIPATVLLVIFGLLWLPARPINNVTGTSDAPPPKGRGFRKTAWLANFTVQLATGGVAAIFPQLATHLGIHADAHGGLLALGRAAALAMIIALQLLTFWRTRLWPLWAAQAVTVAGILVVGAASGWWWFVGAFVVMGAVTGYSYQASIFFTLDEMTEKGKGSGFHEAFLAAGMLTGPLLAGWAGNEFGLRAPYWVCAAALGIGIAAQVAVVLWRRGAMFQRHE